MRGFSLLELSIVIAIIGLISGSVVAGRSMIDAAKVQSVIKDIQKYKDAIGMFQTKYGELPGDMSRATEIWGIAGGTGNNAACFTVDSRTLADPRQTCNGTGDGFINRAIGATMADIWLLNERFRAFQHLSNAGLIEGRFSGKQAGTSQWGSTINENAPKLAFEYATFHLGSLDNVVFSGDATWFNGKYANIMELVPSQEAEAGAAIFTPDFFWKIDSKIDDGKPSTGKVRSVKSTSGWQSNACLTTDVEATSEYNLQNKKKVCSYLMNLL